MRSEKRIFVSIASYRDPELIPTLTDMIATAAQPQSLAVTICWQRNDEDETLFLNAGMTLKSKSRLDEFDVWHFRFHGAQINAIDVHYFASQGACWARSQAERLFAGEDYFLQIDSHCRFAENWDKEMIAVLESLRNDSPKPLLSTYPPAYDPENLADRKQYISRLIFREFSGEGLVMLSSTPYQGTEPRRSGYLAAGFVFADGIFVQEVPNDPQIFFIGEEIAMAARAFTHGYDFYTPHKILLWHYYGRKNERKIWADHNIEAKQTGQIELAWYERDKVAKKRVRSLLGLEEEPADLQQFSLGTQRTLAEFEYSIGVDFQQQAVRTEITGKDPVSFFPPDLIATHTWRKSLFSANKKKITFKSEEIDLTREDIAWWHVGVYSAQNRLLEKKTFTRQQLTDLLNKNSNTALDVEFNFTTPATVRPHIVRMCPFFNTEGWGKVAERPW